MSRDDTIGIFKLKNKYIVVYAQGIEDISECWEDFVHYCKCKSIRWTYSQKKALHIANRLLSKHPHCEYGIKYFNNFQHKDYFVTPIITDNDKKLLYATFGNPEFNYFDYCHNCPNCEIYSFPCLNCAQYVFDFKLGTGNPISGNDYKSEHDIKHILLNI